MLSLSELSAKHPSLLVLDAASECVQVGLREQDGTWRWSESVEGAGTGIYRCLATLKVEVGAVDAFVFCQGPGSILGIRTVAVALRTWQVLRDRPAYRYTSLALAHLGLADPGNGVISDARRGLWNWYTPQAGLLRVPQESLTGALATPAGFKAWAPLPPSTQTAPYCVRELLGRFPHSPLFLEAPSPDAFLHAEPTYAKWVPQIHRAP